MKNVDVNPTKAWTYALSTKEVDQLEKEGLIEPTKLQRACEAFYINKSQKIRAD